eukprot:scaffold3369_cov66-Skeletonema_marinoi.AAC.1
MARPPAANAKKVKILCAINSHPQHTLVGDRWDIVSGDFFGKKGACQLHLQAQVSNPASLQAIHRFLSGGGSGSAAPSSDAEANNGGGGSAQPCPKLFIWIPRQAAKDGQMDDDDDENWDEALASTESFDGRNLGSLAFINASLINTNAAAAAEASTTTNTGGGEIKNARQIQCMVMSPRIYLEETEDDEDQTGESKEDSKEEESGGGGGDASNPGSATFLALQMYARHCFVPAVRAIEALELEEEKKEGNDGMVATAGEGDESAKQTPNRRKTTRIMEGLEDKLRELDVALGQCRRTVLGRIPH